MKPVEPKTHSNIIEKIKGTGNKKNILEFYCMYGVFLSRPNSVKSTARAATRAVNVSM